MRALAWAALFALVGAARADVDVAIGNGVKVAGSLDPGTETETFRFVAPAGAELTVSVKGKKAKGAAEAPAVRIALYDPNDAPIAGGEVQTTDTGAKLTGHVLALSGPHRVEVSSQGEIAGEYQLELTWKVPKKLEFADSAAAEPARFTISLQQGAVATLTATAAPESGARPWISSIEGQTLVHEFPQPPVASKHKVTTPEVPFTGEYTVFVKDQSGLGGGVVDLAVSVKPPKPLKKSLKLNNKVLGKTGLEGGLARGALIGSEGGAIDIGDGGSPIDGSSVSVPADALPNPVPIVIGTGSPIPDEKDMSGAGPTILLAPDGTKFKENVTVTIPFDPALLEGGDLEDLTILTRDKQGEVSVVPGPYTIDPAAGTITFATSHFSDYRAFGPKRVRPADLDGDGIDELVIPAPADASGRGAVFVFRGRRDAVSLDGATTADADFVFTGVNARVSGTPGDLFGSAAATGDVNDDGIADLVVGASRADGERGAVYVFFGGRDFASGSAADADVVLSGIADTRLLGAALLIADVTGDGRPDVVAGAPGTEFNPSETEAGGVYVFPGGPAIANLSIADASVRSVEATEYGAALGVSLAFGDVTGDGVPDLALGSNELQREGDGSVYVFADASSIANELVPATGIRFTAAGSLDLFGDGLAIGDVNGDGTGDVVVGAPGTGNGVVYAFLGSPSLNDRTAASAEITFVLPSLTANAAAGGTLVLANLTGGTEPDLLIGAASRSAGTLTRNGAAYLTRGGPGVGTEFEISAGTATSDEFGVVLTPADVNGDGYLDAILASPHANGGAGYVRVHLGPGLSSARFEIAGVGVQLPGVRDIDFDPPAKK